MAQWNKRSDIDAFAWEAAKIAKFYDNAILTFVAPYLTEENGGNTGFTSIPEFTLSKISGCYSNFYEQPEDPYCLQIKLIKAKSVELVKSWRQTSEGMPTLSEIRISESHLRNPAFPSPFRSPCPCKSHGSQHPSSSSLGIRNVPIAQSARR